VFITIKTRRKYSVNVSESECRELRTYEQAGEVSGMELQKDYEDLYRKEPSWHSSYNLPRTATLGIELDQNQTRMLFCGNHFYGASADSQTQHS